MNYYILRQDDRILEQPSILRSPANIDPEDWIDGKILPDPGPLRITLSPRSGEFRGGIIDGLVTLFHKNLIKELTRLGIDNIQYFPVELEAPDGMIERAYSLINVIGLIEAVDTAKSVIKPRSTGGGQLYSFKIDPVKAKNHRLFRLAEAPTLIIIDEALRNDLTAYEVAGVIMLPTERYDGW